VAVTDPLGNTTNFGYYETQKLKSITDPNGNTTTWNIDIEGRVTVTQYPDSTTVTDTYENTTSRLKGVTDRLGQMKNYQYTADNRLAGINYKNALNPTPDVGFAYDPDFPRIVTMTDGTGTTAYSYVPVGVLGALRLKREIGPAPGSEIA